MSEDEALPIGDAEPAEWEAMQRFAIAYADWESPTRGRKRESMQTVFPDLKDDSAYRKAHRWLAREDVRAFIETIPETRIQAGKMGPVEFGNEMLKIAKQLVHRQEKGDATAAAQFAKLGAIALGFHVRETKDKTPPEARRPAVGTSDMAAQLMEQLQRIQRLQQPVTARLVEATEVEAEEVRPKRDTPWEKPPGERYEPPAKPQGCFVCGADGFMRGDDKIVCPKHVLSQQGAHEQDHARPDDYASPEPEPGNPLS